MQFADSIITALESGDYLTVWETETDVYDQQLTQVMIPSTSFDFLIVRGENVVEFKYYPDGWNYLDLGKPEIELPLSTPDEVILRLSDLLRGIAVQRVPEPNVTPFHRRFQTQIEAMMQ